MLRSGFATIDITPDTRHSLMGYDFRWDELPPGNRGVHDPLLARVIVLHDGTSPAALVNLELCVIEVELARSLRSDIAGKLKTSPDRVILSTTHTHSGPWPRLKGERAAGDSPAERERRKLGEEYAEELRPKLLDAAGRAGGLLYPVSVRAIEAPLGIGYTRRVKSEAGIRHCWNPQESPHLMPEGSPDPTCSVVVLRQPHGPRSHVLWGVGAHPVGLGKTSSVISADWPGLACRMIDAAIPGVRSTFFLGAAGEVHPWIATQEDPAQLELIAGAAAGLVRLLVASGAGVSSPRIGSGDRNVPTRQSDTDKNVCATGEADKGACATGELRIATRTWKCGKLELDLAAWRIGPTLLLAAPVELFASLSRQLRSRVAGPILLATVSNGWTGYWPDRPAFAEGKYEVNASWGIEPGDGERLIDELVSLAGEVS